MRKAETPKPEPVFRRFAYQKLGGKLRTVKQDIPACACNNPVRKTRAKATTCANCGGAVLTAFERLYVKALPK